MLEFMDCPRCKKRIRSDAPKCHRCGALISAEARSAVKGTELVESSEFDDGSPEHAEGGWEPDADEFDYDEFVANEFGGKAKRRPIQKLWYWVAWLLIFLFAIPVVWPLASLFWPS